MTTEVAQTFAESNRRWCILYEYSIKQRVEPYPFSRLLSRAFSKMGASVGITKVDRPVSTIFVDQHLARGEMLLKTNASMRCSFVEFVKKGSWSNAVESREEISVSKISSSDCVWKRFGYKTPLGNHGGKVSQSSSSETTFDESVRSVPSVDVDCGRSCLVPFDTSSTKSLDMKNQEYGARPEIKPNSINKLFRGSDLRAILVAVLYPVYLCSPEYKELRNDRIQEAEAAPLPRCKTHTHSAPMSRRVREWLLSVASSFDNTSLKHYLADPRASWIEEYKRGLADLPVSVNLACVNTKTQESVIVYSNNAPANTVDGGVPSPHLHVRFGSDCSSAGADQVTRAVFTARRYKRNIVYENGTCQLRALRPVFNAQGVHVYALGLESAPFPVDFADQADRVVAEYCQEFDDVLDLLPVFLKC